MSNYLNVPLRMNYLEYISLNICILIYPNISLPCACLVSCCLVGVFLFQKPTSGGISSNLVLVFLQHKTYIEEYTVLLYESKFLCVKIVLNQARVILMLNLKYSAGDFTS